MMTSGPKAKFGSETPSRGWRDDLSNHFPGLTAAEIPAGTAIMSNNQAEDR
jgi:hypothetical protein